MASIAEILLAQGARQANARRRKGELVGGLIAGLSQVPGDLMAQRDAERQAEAQAIRQQQIDARAELRDTDAHEKNLREIEDRKAAIAQREAAQIAAMQGDRLPLALQAIDSWEKRGIVDPEDAAQLRERIATPDGLKQTFDFIAQIKPAARPNPVAVKGLNAEGVAGTQFVVPEEGAFVPDPPPAPPTPPKLTLQEQANEALRAGDGEGYSRIMKVIKDTEAAGRAPVQRSAGSFEQQIADALARGDNATVARLTKASELASGARARTQGRPVTSGDAGKIADFQTSLDDLNVLRETLTETKDATGTMAAIGAGIWTPITNATGFGVEAKSRQGVIDRVKQVIGKALEGGVLRKEDEYKYEKILPTIKDSAEVAASKLAGLDKAIKLRLQTTIDSLSDAGYDVGAFTARQPHGGDAIRSGAAAFLKQSGYASDDDAVSTFLKNNPTWKP